jgi:ribosomal protein S12 methylthiotransferase accessory factor
MTNGKGYYWLAPGVEVVPIDGGGVLFQSDVVSLKLDGKSAVFFTESILPLLDGTRTPGDVATTIGGIDENDIANHLVDLADAGVLIYDKTPRNSDGPSSLFVGEFVETLGVDKLAAVERLAAMRVVIVGLPDIGALLADQLAAFGIGHLTLIDPYPLRHGDQAFMAGLSKSEINEPRGDVIARSLQTRWPEVSIKAISTAPLDYNMVEAAAEGADFLFGTFAPDLPVVQQWVNRAAHTFRVPALFAQVNGIHSLIGPLVLPEETACFMCWRMRHLACANDFNDAMAFEEYQDARRTPPLSPSPGLPSIVQTAAGILSTEFLKTALALGQTFLADAVSDYDALKAVWNRHPFLHRPDCPICSKKKRLTDTEQPPLETLEEAKAGDILVASEQLISNHCGVVRSFSRIHKDVTEPEKPYIYRAELANLRFLDADQDAFLMSSGKGNSHVQARIGALGEAVERYSSCLIDNRRITRAIRGELDGPSLDPRRLVLFQQEQYETLKYQAYSDETVLGWIKARSLGNGDEIYVPALAVAMAHEVINDEAYLFPITSNGLAAGATLPRAVLSAAYEVVERDGFLNVWLHRLPCRRIDPYSHPDPEVRELCTAYARRGMNMELYLAPLDHPVPVFIGLGVDLTGKPDRPSVVVGLGADLNATTAAKSALFEVAQVRPALCMRLRDPEIIQRMAELLNEPSRVCDLSDHDLLYAMPEMLSSFDFLRKSDISDFDWEIGDAVATPIDCLQTLVESLNEDGTDILYCNLTSSDIAPFNLHVVRAIIPDYQPMHFGRNERRLAATRLYELPRRLGFRDDLATSATLNDDPHPLA